MAWTDRQQDAIDSRGESLLVSAAAGSGKTSVLVERIINLVKEGTPLNRMLVVTFTNAAASEMKERVALIAGRSSVRHANISTFHKFAMDVIRKYYHITGINPSFAICDDFKQNILKNEAMDEMFEDMFEKNDPQFIDFLNCYASAKSNMAAKQIILDFCTFLESLPDKEEFSKRIADGSMYRPESYLSYAAGVALEAVKRARDLNDVCVNILLNPELPAMPMPKMAVKFILDSDGLQDIIALLESEKYEAAFEALSTFKFSRAVSTKDEKSSYILVEEELGKLRDILKDDVKSAAELCSGLSLTLLSEEKEMLRKPLSGLVFLSGEFERRYQKKKQSAGLMDFSDIEHNALKILENKAVCDELRDSFDYIFVDEYQDSNLVQEELLRRISRPDNMFMVGDVKQSIYKFRLAEPEIFLNKYGSFKSGAVSRSRVIDLNSNFRSKAGVICCINDIFKALMQRSVCGIDYDDDAALKEGAVYSGPYSFKPELFIAPAKVDEELIADLEIEELKAAEIEASTAAEIIKEYHGRTIHDSKKNIDRPLEYKDMVILMRATKGKGELFYNALEKAGIPVYFERSEGYFDTPEVQVTLNLLRIIDNFSQDLPLISVLHFPCFGFTADQLAEIRIFSNKQGNHKTSYSKAFRAYAESGDNEALKEKAKQFIEKIAFWKKKEAALPLADFLWELLFESGMAELCSALPSGDQRFANLRALVDKVQTFESQNASGLFGFINYIEAISGKGKAVETGQVSMLGEGVDAVRIMTIHKSKGLEFPFVLLAGIGNSLSGGRNTSSLYTHKDFGISLKLVEPQKCLCCTPVSAKLIKHKKALEEFAETIRVLYVACTRAKDMLIFLGTAKHPEKYSKGGSDLIKTNPFTAKTYLDMVRPFIPSEQIHFVSVESVTKTENRNKEISDYILNSLDTGFDVDESALKISAAEIEEMVSFDYSPDPESMLKSKYSVSEIAMLEREKKKPEKDHYPVRRRIPAFIKEESLDAAAKGTAYHSVMEHIPFTPENKSPEDVALFIEELKNKNILTPAEAAVVDPARISAFFSSEIGKRAVASDEIYKEAPFVMKTVFEGRTLTVQGTIDCYFREGDEYVLLDYKSNYMDPESIESEKERLKENYIPQLALYREALEKISGVKVKEGVLYLFGIDDSIRV